MAVLFHFAVLGVLALVSVIDVPVDNAVEAVVWRLGMVLIIIGFAHWVAVSALTRIRDREEFDEFAHEREARRMANDQANAAYGTHVPDPGVGPAYNGDSATAVVNRQQPYPRG